MKFKRVWAVYFSPTGTTKKVACHMADELADLLKAKRCDYDFTLPKARAGFASISGADAGDLEASEIKGEESGSDLAVFATPTYAGRVPNVLLKYLSSIRGNGAAAIPVGLLKRRNGPPRHTGGDLRQQEFRQFADRTSRYTGKCGFLYCRCCGRLLRTFLLLFSGSGKTGLPGHGRDR